MTERVHFHFSLSCIGEGNGNPLQCSCLKNPRDLGAWWAAVYGVSQIRTRLKRCSSSSSSSSRHLSHSTKNIYLQLWLSQLDFESLKSNYLYIKMKVTLWDPIDCNHQAPPRDRIQVSCIDSLPSEPSGKPKNTGVGSLSLLQWIFPIQESNQGFLHCKQILCQLSYQGRAW